MNWRLDFEWHELSHERRASKVDPWAPHKTPVMAGGLFAITKKRFDDLAHYDQGMEIWGGENLELSFKAWMCQPNGGHVEDDFGIEILPCSRVGHVFRTWSPYGIQEDQINRNNIRVAQVWLDEFKFLFFDRLGRFGQSPRDRLGDFGDVEPLLEWRRRRRCKSFAWFMNEVAYTLPYFVVRGGGEIRHVQSGKCLDKRDRVDNVGEPVDVLECHDRGGNQYWLWDEDERILRDYACLGIVRESQVGIVDCQLEAVRWNYDQQLGAISVLGSDLCMTLDEDGEKVTLQVCEPGEFSQMFHVTIFDPEGLSYQQLFEKNKT